MTNNNSQKQSACNDLLLLLKDSTDYLPRLWGVGVEQLGWWRIAERFNRLDNLLRKRLLNRLIDAVSTVGKRVVVVMLMVKPSIGTIVPLYGISEYRCVKHLLLVMLMCVNSRELGVNIL